jgi:predicted metal-dependent hydrolase
MKVNFVERISFFSGKGPSLNSSTAAKVCAALAVLLLTAAAGGCGKTAPTSVPDGVIKDFIAKHETMVETSLASLYIHKEQDTVAEKVSSTIAARETDGTLEDLQSATFDFTGLELELLGEKDDHINDEIKSFLKVAIKGSYIVNIHESARNVTVNETVILEKEDGAWKITETINPWS